MCGLLGFFSVRKFDSKKLIALLNHRGSDDEGMFYDVVYNKQLFLGHKRLSIQDLSSAGHQPMVSEDRNTIIIYNGEVYNFKELKIKYLKNVTVTGFVETDRKQILFEEANMFIFLSDFEGMSNAVLEAMSFGLPVITTNVGGIASVFTNNRNGMLVDEYNKILQILKNEDLYKTISITNFNDAKQKVWSNIVAKRMIKIFNEVSYLN